MMTKRRREKEKCREYDTAKDAKESVLSYAGRLPALWLEQWRSTLTGDSAGSLSTTKGGFRALDRRKMYSSILRDVEAIHMVRSSASVQKPQSACRVDVGSPSIAPTRVESHKRGKRVMLLLRQISV